ncbi:winged helix-turn-helix transcriptional regulator [Sphingomonas abietis]|uniref:Helix-turn-helix domain-containing protein n=1 Tax=Sphingomonas abietis TaxID=3012344 RepID=A0ABY7NQ17_9SPHN|nr:helix-turn-helix domain-containing protein [Sphingomonas abietis]WBO23618.1 helix-turn-helix domain-containing protein [Sphingomonas abietis]
MEKDRTPPLSLSARLARGDLMAADCPSRAILQHMTSRWGVLVLIALEDRTLRFGEMKRMIGGVSERMLAQTLQWLEGDGLVIRKAFAVVPPHVEYRLTPLGVEAAHRVRSLADWIETAMPQMMAAWDARGAEALASAD